MNRAISFDTLAYAKKLIAAGFTERQAEVQAEALSEIIDKHIATNQDIRGLEVKLKEMEDRLKYELTVRLGAMIAASIAITVSLTLLSD
ncbi:MAG: hypothetical protein HKL88_08905 [Bacteroidia bacterium]|nr:hypothetical protein [Bacteroidia bacterium]